MNTLLRLAILPALFAASCATANAGVLTYQNVTFTTTFSGNVLTLEIDAAHPNGDWINAKTMGAVGIKDIGTFSSVQLLQAPGAAAGWVFSTDELNTNGCQAGGQPTKNVCYEGTHVNLVDDMVFKFAFTGGTQDFTAPHLKVNFFDDEGKKAGTLLSMVVPPDTPNPVSEPGTAGMMMSGLALAGFMARRRRMDK